MAIPLGVLRKLQVLAEKIFSHTGRAHEHPAELTRQS